MPTFKTPPSLRPGPEVIEAAAVGNKVARAIRDAWKFKFPVRTMTAAQLDAIDPKVIFTGRISDQESTRRG